MTALKELFLLDPEVIHLNHGSFGACPRPVFEVYQAWQKELERQPVEFLGRRATALMAESRQKLAEFLGIEADELVYFTNPTTAINMLARSLKLTPGDEILTTNHEYGAIDRTWRFNCLHTEARYIPRAVPLPVASQADFVESFWAGVTARTRVIFISHITSSTGLIFPVQEICRRARQAGILSIVDGAHVPGQIPLHLPEIGSDIYTGACHKWLCAPKGAAFLYARREIQPWLDPLVVSWGYESEQPSASQFIDYHEWQGTRDLAAFLSVPAAIEFQATHNWEQVRRDCHALAIQTRQRINALTGQEPICPEDWFSQMFSVRLPDDTVLDNLKERLYEEHRIEVPLLLWNEIKLMRVSFQAYNTPADVDALLEACAKLLPLRLPAANRY